MEIKSRLDISQLFWEVDEFCQSFEAHCSQQLKLGSGKAAVAYRSRLSISEVTTIVIAFQGSGYRTFKAFYTLQVLPHWRSAFPNLVSYNRFLELMPWSMMVLCCFLQTRRGEGHRH